MTSGYIFGAKQSKKKNKNKTPDVTDPKTGSERDKLIKWIKMSVIEMLHILDITSSAQISSEIPHMLFYLCEMKDERW